MEREPLDFWTFASLARRRLADEFGYERAEVTELLLMLNRASGIVTYDLESTVHRPRGRSWAAFRVLYVLWLAGPIEAKGAAELTGMSRAALSNLLRSLVEDGVVSRERDPEDGRSIRLALTPAGEAEITEAFRAHHDREVDWAGGLTESEQTQLVGLLDKLVAGRTDLDIRRRH